MPDRSPSAVDADGSLWAFDAFLPIGSDPTTRVTLGEGMTPLVAADDQADADRRSFAPWNAEFKLEYVSPTGSFKDRGATTTITRARELGVEHVVEDSSGNAGSAIATYAARAGIDAEVYVPASASPGKRRAIERAGAETVRIEGSRREVTEACLEAVGEGSWYASHAWHPAFRAGTATFAYEVASQRGWTVPDAVVVPVGHGTLLLGAFEGFAALRAAGWTDRLPELFAAQAAGTAPIVEAVHGSDGPGPSVENTLAEGIRIDEPVQLERILEAIRTTGGDAVTVSERETRRELERLHRGGFYTEPACAVAPAALRALRERGRISPRDDVVVPLTGSGLKARPGER